MDFGGILFFSIDSSVRIYGSSEPCLTYGSLHGEEISFAEVPRSSKRQRWNEMNFSAIYRFQSILVDGLMDRCTHALFMGH